jgi:hypothetical protein
VSRAAAAIERSGVGQTIEVDQEGVLRSLGLNPRSAATQALLLACERYELDPVLKHAVLIKDNLYISHSGLLHVAHRSGQLDGIEVVDEGETQSHYWAKVSVWRKDKTRPFTYTGRFAKAQRNPYGPEMALKTAERAALKRAFDVALLTQDEVWDTPESMLPSPGLPDDRPALPENPSFDIETDRQPPPSARRPVEVFADDADPPLPQVPLPDAEPLTLDVEANEKTSSQTRAEKSAHASLRGAGLEDDPEKRAEFLAYVTDGHCDRVTGISDDDARLVRDGVKRLAAGSLRITDVDGRVAVVEGDQ